MRHWKGYCHRCRKKSAGYIMSWFNRDLICFECSEKEKEREDYKYAREAEEEAVRKGDLNFPGIGK